MAKRRHIRETAVQWLYCVQQRGGTPPPGADELFWRVVTEAPRRQLLAATARCVRHLAGARPERHAAWLERLAAARAAIAAQPGGGPLADALAAVEPAESLEAAAIDALARVPADDADDEVGVRLDAALGRVFAAAAAAAAQRRRFFDVLTDFPALGPALEALGGATRRLDRISERLLELRDPSRLPERGEFDALHEAWRQLDGLREGAERLAGHVLDLLGPIDARLAAVVENFTPERIDPVDRSILRLAAWEILFDPAVPKAVAINEAVEIAKRFGTTDSGRFINGVLDRLNPPSD